MSLGCWKKQDVKRLLAVGILLALGPRTNVAAPAIRSIFDFNCASVNDFKVSASAMLDAQVISAGAPEGSKFWADRAVTFDPNGDGQPEVAVPLWCGATGNCTWAIYGGTPTRLLGRVHAMVILVPEPSADSRILGYAHLSAMDGTMSSFVLRGGLYVQEAEAAVAASDAMERLGCDGGKVSCCR